MIQPGGENQYFQEFISGGHDYEDKTYAQRAVPAF